ncbi:MAG TPA: hypothetical protein VFT86_06505 [Gaiellaceae bacterium]|nr:hypothetical protein [Gaiellaceae bacterium]
MLRLLAVGALAAVVLMSGPAAREPLTKEEYLSVVRNVVDAKATDRLFDDVVNFTYFEREPCRVCRFDTTTLVDEQWLRAERRLRRDIDALTSRFTALLPPGDVARLHAAWMTALERCSAALRSLEADQGRLASGDFETMVAERTGPACFERFQEIIPAFEKRGYVFARAS